MSKTTEAQSHKAIDMRSVAGFPAFGRQIELTQNGTRVSVQSASAASDAHPQRDGCIVQARVPIETQGLQVGVAQKETAPAKRATAAAAGLRDLGQSAWFGFLFSFFFF